MVGKTLNLYIFKYMLRMMIYFIIGISLLIFLVDFTELNNRLSNTDGYVVLFGLTLSALRLPFIMQVALPFVTLAAAMATLMQLNKKNELVVARSVGVSAWQFLAPIWVAAVLFGIFALLVINPLSATGFSAATEMEAELRGQPAQIGPFSSNRPWLRQDAEDQGTYLIGAERVSGNGVVLLNAVFLKINADGDISERIDAPRASLGDSQWNIPKALVSRAGEATIDTGERIIPTSLDAAVIREALVPAELIPFFQLGEQIETAQSFGVPSNPYRMQYHSLAALPALLVAMTLIAATVSLRFARFGQSAGMILGGIVAGFVLYVLTEVTKSFGGAGIIPPVPAAWLPVVVAGMFGVAYLLHREDG